MGRGILKYRRRKLVHYESFIIVCSYNNIQNVICEGHRLVKNKKVKKIKQRLLNQSTEAWMHMCIIASVERLRFLLFIQISISYRISAVLSYCEKGSCSHSSYSEGKLLRCWIFNRSLCHHFRGGGMVGDVKVRSQALGDVIILFFFKDEQNRLLKCWGPLWLCVGVNKSRNHCTVFPQ